MKKAGHQWNAINGGRDTGEMQIAGGLWISGVRATAVEC